MKPTWVRPALAVMAAGFVLAAAAAALSPACGCCLGLTHAPGAGRTGGAFWPRLGATVLPFAVTGGVVAFIHFGPTVGRRGGRLYEPFPPTDGARSPAGTADETHGPHPRREGRESRLFDSPNGAS